MSAPEAGPLSHLYEGTLDCVHCGLCLPVCPTYRETGRESASPRGRIYLMRATAEGRVPLGERLAEEAYLCLGCRACETACPSGVRFGRLVEETRAAVEDAGLRRGAAKRIETWALRGVIPHPRRLRAALGALRVVQLLRLDRIGAPLLPRSLRRLAASAPLVPPRRERSPLAERFAAHGARRGRVGFFTGCVMPELFGATQRATVEVLVRNGFEVVVPRGQGCCGALHAHAGDAAFARDLARRNVEAFRGLDAVVVDSAGCGAAMREAGDWLPDVGGDFAKSVRDVCELLDEVGLRAPRGRVEGRVCYDDPCHLVHGQGVREAPRRLLAQIEGLSLVAHDDPTSCCGAAGIYNLTHRAMSEAVLARKLASLAAADPDWIATGNPGCLMQLANGAARAGLRAQVVHPVELLARAYRNERTERE